MASSDIVVTPVEGKADLKAFIQLPVRLYRGHKGYIPHLNVERDEAFSPKKNPLFRHVEVGFFLARRGGKVVGRITAQIDRAYLERYADDTGHFGCLAAEDDPAIFAALFAAAESKYGRARYHLLHIERDRAGWRLRVQIRALTADLTGCEPDGDLVFHSGDATAMVA